MSHENPTTNKEAEINWQSNKNRFISKIDEIRSTHPEDSKAVEQLNELEGRLDDVINSFEAKNISSAKKALEDISYRAEKSDSEYEKWIYTQIWNLIDSRGIILYQGNDETK